MSPLSFILPLLLALAALVLIGAFVKMVYESVGGSAPRLLGGVRLRRKVKLVETADLLMREGKLEEAAEALKHAFVLNHQRGDEAFLERLYTHHLGILSRLVTIAEKRNRRVENLPLLEGLLASRNDLIRGYEDVSFGKRKLRERRKEKGMETPPWADDEFDRKLRELIDRLDTNRKSIESQLDDLTKSLGTEASGEEVTYH
jgi:tetratricopeptide (TPR) repeat protein